MDRASDSGSEGWGFESLPVYQNKKADTRLGIRFLVWRYAPKRDSKDQIQPAGGRLAATARRSRTSIFFRFAKENANESLPVYRRRWTPAIPQSASLPAPFTQGSLLLFTIYVPIRVKEHVLSKIGLSSLVFRPPGGRGANE